VFEAENIFEGLDGDDCTGKGIPLVSDPLKEVLHRFQGAAAQIMPKLSIIEKVQVQDLRDAQDETPMGNP
jgi:hypothetical protein